MPPWFNVPNLLTLVRVILVPFIIQNIIAGHHVLALALFAVAAATDGLDGAAARHFGAATKTGAYFDPIADKILLSGVFVALAIGRIVPWWFVGIVFGRDIYILFAAGILMLCTSIREFPPSVWGKVSTFVQIGTAVVWMARNILASRDLDSLSTAMLWVCTAFTIWSGIHYTWRSLQAAHAH